MRPIWTGAISFGLLNIPVRLYSATREGRLDLDMLDRRDMNRIHFKRVNAETGKEVPAKEIVKGYNFEGQYVVLEDQDFEEAAPEKTKLIEIQSFVDDCDIDPMYFEGAYYIEPDRTGARAYALLREALKRADKVGIATFVMRTKEVLAAIKPLSEVIVLARLKFESEIRDCSEIKAPPQDMLMKKQELNMACELIEQYSTDLDLSQFHDTYTEALMKRIEEKARGKTAPKRKLEVVPTKSRDIMAQLKASLEQRRGKKAS